MNDKTAVLSQSTSILNCFIYRNIAEEKTPGIKISKVNDRSYKLNMTELVHKIEWKEL